MYFFLPVAGWRVGLLCCISHLPVKKQTVLCHILYAMMTFLKNNYFKQEHSPACKDFLRVIIKVSGNTKDLDKRSHPVRVFFILTAFLLVINLALKQFYENLSGRRKINFTAARPSQRWQMQD